MEPGEELVVLTQDEVDAWNNVSAVESKPASRGRIKTSHFFPLNRSEMF
jgi:hypothetical protein